MTARLPEDLRIYSSAESDLTRALLARVKAEHTATEAARAAQPPADDGVSILTVLAICAAALATAGSVLALRR